MRRSLAFLLVALSLALGWLAWRSTNSAPTPLAPEDAVALAAPSPEKLAALESAEKPAVHAIESQPGASREALEVRRIQTRAATITIQPAKVEGERRGMIIVWCYIESSQATHEPAEITLVTPRGSEIVHPRGRGQDTFRGLAPGLHSLLVRDPGFEDVRVDSVATGSHVLVEFVGTVRIRPRAVDAETGAALDASTLRLLGFGRTKEYPADAQGWFNGLPGGDLDLRIFAPGYEQTRLVAAGLTAGESREVDVRFTPAGEIRGIVRDEADGLPVANAMVTLDSAASQHAWVQDIGESVWSNRSRSAPSDSKGRFAFKDLSLGQYSVRASYGGSFDSPLQDVKLAEGARVRELVLRVRTE